RALMVGSEPQVVKLKNIQHLYTPVRATLKTSAHVLQFVERMHPTPALGGDPQAAAVASIAQIEPLARGWYGAPVGWLDGVGGGEFAVAIRSAVALGERVRLYAGAGIVGDSVPAKEWDETALKFKPLLGALGLTGTRHSVLGAQSAREVLSSEF
ncbi:MAG: chorismate-binding protein, partial [Anaerolineae bacterium]|nr:chorismate-binding protein [Anaerolineae bacterium]